MLNTIPVVKRTDKRMKKRRRCRSCAKSKSRAPDRNDDIVDINCFYKSMNIYITLIPPKIGGGNDRLWQNPPLPTPKVVLRPELVTGCAFSRYEYLRHFPRRSNTNCDLPFANSDRQV